MEVASEGPHCVLRGEGGGAGGVCDQRRSRYDAGDGHGEPRDLAGDIVLYLALYLLDKDSMMIKM